MSEQIPLLPGLAEPVAVDPAAVDPAGPQAGDAAEAFAALLAGQLNLRDAAPAGDGESLPIPAGAEPEDRAEQTTADLPSGGNPLPLEGAVVDVLARYGVAVPSAPPGEESTTVPEPGEGEPAGRPPTDGSRPANGARQPAQPLPLPVRAAEGGTLPEGAAAGSSGNGTTPVAMPGLERLSGTDRILTGEASARDAGANSVPLSHGASPASGHEQASSVRAAAPALDAPVGGKGWEDALGNRVLWMVGRNVQSAEIRLNPPQLGPLDVRVVVHQDQASVTFTAHHAVVREALEAALPRLREMFTDAGLSLVDVDVSQHAFAEQRQPGTDAFPGQPGLPGEASPYLADDKSGDAETAAEYTVTGSALIDYYV